MKQIIGLIAGILLFTSCGREKEADGGWDIMIKGRVTFPQPGQIFLQKVTPDGQGRIDTISLANNNTYAKKLHLTEPGHYLINFYGKQMLRIILYKNDVEINVDGNTQQGLFEIKGSPEYDLMTKVQSIMNTVQNSPDIVSLKEDYSKAGKVRNEGKLLELQERYTQIMKKANDQVASLLKDQPASLGVVELLGHSNLLDRDEYFDLYVNAAEKLKKEMPDVALAKQFIDDVEKSKKTAVGRTAPEISMPNPDGDTVRLSSFRGKYVLVDFWAKWCGPCRRENPTVVKAYKKFKDKGFEVFGVSLDRTREDWVQAIREDGLTWTHVSDLKYFESRAAMDYNITAIPFSILLDPKGVILAKNLRGPALDRKLSELFPGK